MNQQTTTPTDLDKLVIEHRAIDEQLQELERRVYLTADEELEVHRLKKLKLAKKDQIQSLRTRFEA